MKNTVVMINKYGSQSPKSLERPVIVSLKASPSALPKNIIEKLVQVYLKL